MSSSDWMKDHNLRALRDGEKLYDPCGDGAMPGVDVTHKELKATVHLLVIALMLPGTIIAGVIALARHMGR